MKKTQHCEKCKRDITANNYQRHVMACIGPVVKKIRGVDFDPNHGYKTGKRQAWNKGIKIGPNQTIVQRYNEIRKSTDTSEFKSHGAIRRKVLEEQNNTCAKCGLDSWLGVKITLELNHIDGIRSNNTRSNLECLCPNCHSLTPTWRGRNRLSMSHNSVVEYRADNSEVDGSIPSATTNTKK